MATVLAFQYWLTGYPRERNTINLLCFDSSAVAIKSCNVATANLKTKM